ncbi:hypothetical protein Psed_6868 (plasmid) [Pseudonocardia dioxanivorans CB1190]|uniref:Uncharacterized protein n=1 Tax=Pseudonocardia dioxanivorans (strain ATCC 55486 / DSM 44775 / JCM 13855 / CB1190) TaxID=675635 RepID=F2L6P5_PSEUX|nr:hypothetical protein [Pseudonocardia dioxanivorans]AEA28939.1 hypothetical protein Psed_6868 [Pseudonocardia dioxanivorans CB1190]GJF02885.1 hypothetical protein PSD17_18470 [Pseudonocardia sp. D17]
MDLSRWLRRVAARRPHVLIVAARNGVAVRLAVEAELSRRDWPIADTPADADVLLVAGRAGPELTAAIEAIWASVPQPRTYLAIDAPEGLEATLDRASADLAAARPAAGPAPSAPTAAEPIEDGRGGTPRHLDGNLHPDEKPGSPQHGGHEQDGGHEQHGGHGGHGEMEMPGGLAMADLGDDRDGLMLDRLNVALGPVLPDWPAGLVLEVALQGDVVQQAHARLVDDPPGEPFWTSRTSAALGDGDCPDIGRRAVARELDAVARVLAVAGWAAPAAGARRLRDRLLTGASLDPTCAAVEALVRRIRRSRTLHRMVRGLPHVPALVALRLEALGLAVEALHEPTGDAIATRAPTSRARPVHSARYEQARIELAEVARLVVGTDLAVARLLLAAADPATDGDTTVVPGDAPVVTTAGDDAPAATTAGDGTAPGTQPGMRDGGRRDRG